MTQKILQSVTIYQQITDNNLLQNTAKSLDGPLIRGDGASHSRRELFTKCYSLSSAALF